MTKQSTEAFASNNCDRRHRFARRRRRHRQSSNENVFTTENENDYIDFIPFTYTSRTTTILLVFMTIVSVSITSSWDRIVPILSSSSTTTYRMIRSVNAFSPQRQRVQQIASQFSSSSTSSWNNAQQLQYHHLHHDNNHKLPGVVLSMALIYGWDDYDDPADGDKKMTQQPRKSGIGGEDNNNNDDSSSNSNGSTTGGTGLPYVTADNFEYSPFAPTVECPTVGATVAETLTGDKFQTGSLARLAVRFAPAEHSGLNLQDIEHVRVLCVHSNSLELEATLCETHGCVSLHVPIQFPSSCSTSTTNTGGVDSEDGAEAHFEACVLQHLETLDDGDDNVVVTSSSTSDPTTTTTTSSEMFQQWKNDEQLTNIPTWWIEPTKTDLALVKECDTLKGILNEDDFVNELISLGNDALKGTTMDSGIPYDTLVIEQSKCMALCPTGIALKLLTKRTDMEDDSNNNKNNKVMMILDVFYPFGNGSTTSQMNTPDSLRAAVLGAVAKASD